MSKTALVIVGVGAACASVALVGSMTKIPFGAMSNAMQPKMEPRTIGSAVFLGFANITVPIGTVLNLTFTPSFGAAASPDMSSSSLRKGGEGGHAGAPTESGGLVVPALFSTKGREAIVASSCGSFDEATKVYRGDTSCVAALVRGVIEADPEAYVAAGEVEGPAFLPAVVSDRVAYGGVTNFESKGFYFAVLLTAPLPVTLSSISITSRDLNSTVSLPDIRLPGASAAAGAAMKA